jgi:hypothetical protein
MINNIYNIKLTDKDVYTILYLSKIKGLPPSQIVGLYPVTKDTIKDIVNGKSRKDCYEVFMELYEKNPQRVKKIFDGFQ